MSGGRRVASSVIAATSIVVALLATIGGLVERHVHRDVHEAIVVRTRAAAIDDDGTVTIDLREGTRVDVIGERASSSRVRVGDAEGWVSRDTLRALPAVRP
jgi:ribosomal protein L14